MKREKPVVMIVECYSTSVNYIRDLRERGYEPVLFECRVPPARRELERALNDKAYAFNGDPLPAIVTEADSYAETLETVRGVNPIKILFQFSFISSVFSEVDRFSP